MEYDLLGEVEVIATVAFTTFEEKGEDMAHSPLVYRVAQEHLTFTEAMVKVAAGKIIAREDWEDEPECRCRFVDERLCIFRNDEWHPWIITLGDMVGEDWVVVEEE